MAGCPGGGVASGSSGLTAKDLLAKADQPIVRDVCGMEVNGLQVQLAEAEAAGKHGLFCFLPFGY